MKKSVLIVGAGPAGLATAACLKDANVGFDLIDRNGIAGGAYARLFPELVLLSLSRNVALPGFPFLTRGRYPRVSAYRAYLTDYSRIHKLTIGKDDVQSIEDRNGQFVVKFAGERQPKTYSAVVVATGIFDHPFCPSIPGLDAGPEAVHSSALMNTETYRDCRILIVGGGTSAVETAERFASKGIPVVLAARRRIRPLPKTIGGIDLHAASYRLLPCWPGFLTKAYCAGDLTLPPADRGFRKHVRGGLIAIGGSLIQFEGRVARFADGQKSQFDIVVLATGYRFAFPFLSANLSAPAPFERPPPKPDANGRLYFVGRRCASSPSSEFLVGIAKDAQMTAKRIASELSDA